MKLFMERAAASGSRFELSDADAPIVAGICSRLDGIALAIEIAAGRVGTHGIAGTASLLDKRLSLHWQGRRTALPRHQTLHSLLDWSHGLLAESERLVLRRLSIFVGTFTVEAAQAVACGGALDAAHVIDAVDGLVAKSLVSALVADDGVTRYRLLETTRVYALERLEESGEAQATAHCHAKYFTRLLDSIAGGRVEPSHDNRAPSLSEHLGNVRAALEWCFDHSKPIPGKAGLGVDLAAASVPVFLDLSLLSECNRWSVAALALLDDVTRGSRREMVLQEAWAISSTWTRGNGDDIRTAITRGLEIAQGLGETSHRLRLLVGLHILLIRLGDFPGSFAVAEQLKEVAQATADASCMILADWLLGSSQHFMGDQAAALRHFQRGLAHPDTPRSVQLFGLDYRVRLLVPFARVLWLTGCPEQAMKIARQAIAEAHGPLSVCFSLLYTAPLFLWCGEYDAAHDVLDRLTAHPNWHALPSFHATGLALKGELLIRLGEAEQGTALLGSARQAMKADRQKLLATRAGYGLAEGLAAIGRLDEARAVICDAIAGAEDGGEILELPELLRIKGTILLSMTSREAEAEDCLAQSLAVARQQSALAWELRTAITLARLRERQGRSEDARQLLSTVYARFTEGFATSDLKEARQLLASYRAPST